MGIPALIGMLLLEIPKLPTYIHTYGYRSRIHVISRGLATPQGLDVRDVKGLIVKSCLSTGTCDALHSSSLFPRGWRLLASARLAPDVGQRRKKRYVFIRDTAVKTLPKARHKYSRRPWEPGGLSKYLLYSVSKLLECSFLNSSLVSHTFLLSTNK
jgi:hypothetical protein